MSDDPVIRGVAFAVRDASRPLLVLGPSLGTSVKALWADVIDRLSPVVDVVGWDLPGHGSAPDLPEPAQRGAVTIAGLAREVADLAAETQRARGAQGAPYWYAGVSVGGAVGLQLLLDAPHAIAGAALLATGARLGTQATWTERAELVARLGTPSQIARASTNWFAHGFIERSPDAATRLFACLQTAGPHGYSAVCEAIGAFDVRERLGEIVAPVVAVAGDADATTPIASLAAIAAGVADGRLHVVHGAAHQLPAEAPEEVAAILLEFVAGGSRDPQTRAGRLAGAMATRREVLGRDHVARAVENTTAFTSDFQDLITRFAWGEIWSRPGLDRRMRSAVTVTALVAGGHWEELAMHVRAARRNGVTEDEIREILLQTAVYCSIPSAHRAFAIADEALRDFVGNEPEAG